MIKTIAKGIGTTFVKIRDRVIQFSHDDTGWLEWGGKRMYFLAIAITANVTTTTAPAGSMAFTTHATGRDKVFFSDGSKWQVSTAAVPVKATGAELDTGTDDAKFATALALADSSYIKVETPDDLKAYDPTLYELLGRVFDTHRIPMDVFHGRQVRRVDCGFNVLH